MPRNIYLNFLALKNWLRNRGADQQCLNADPDFDFHLNVDSDTAFDYVANLDPAPHQSVGNMDD
jgi:hypothetical protein